jgi:hypothetical protein
MGELTRFPRPQDGPVLVVPPAPGWARAARAAGWRVRRALPPRPWPQAGALVVASPSWSAASIVLALSRGAGVVLDPVDTTDAVGAADPRLAIVLDDAPRAGAALWPRSCPEPPAPFGLDGATACLLDALARGCRVGTAARAANMSLRTAHRRLRRARGTLGAATTAAAVGRWVQGGSAPAVGAP